ncbi:hypothetical protein MBLNU457_7749t1 [Dothideomycetes sp. NU457]
MSDSNRIAENAAAKKEVQAAEAAAEAGPGAAQTDAVPLNETLENEKEQNHNVASSNASTAVPTDHEGDEQASQKAEAPPAGPPKKQNLEDGPVAKKAIIMLALCMAVFLAAVDVTIITTALPTISEHFHSSSGYIWIGSAYLLANSASTPLWGKISDIFGRKPILLVANATFFIGSLIAALSTSIGMLIAARAIQGTGGGGLVSLVNICISDLFSLRSRGAYFGIIGGVWAVASAVGPVIGGAFTEYVTWRWCFYINLPLDGIAFAIILFFLDLETPKTPLVEGLKAIDWTGALLVVGATLMLLFGLEYGGVTYPWGSAIVICLIVFGFVTFALFFINEAKFAKYPVMPLRIFKYRSNCAALACCFLHGIVFISASYFLPLYFQASRGATPILSGVYLLPTALSLSFGSIATGIFIKKTGQYLPPIYVGFFLMTLGFGLFTNFYANSSWAKLILYQIIAGLGVGPLFQSPLIALQTQVKPQDIATATATFGFVRNLGTAISVVIGQVVYQNQMVKQTSALRAALGDRVANALSGSGAGANVQVIDSLPPAQKNIAQAAFADSLHPMWIMYVCLSGVGLLVSILIKRKTLTKQHEVTKTGLEAEKANAAEAARLKAEKKAHKKHGDDSDVEKGPDHVAGSKA